MSLSVIGHDPGVTGGLIHIRDGVAVDWMRIPMDGRRVNATKVFEWMMAMSPVSFLISEKVQSIPGDTPMTAWSFSGAEHAVIACAQIAGIVDHFVTPQTWQKAILQGQPVATRQQRISATFAFAAHRFPALDDVLQIKANDGIASAACIAEFGLRLRRANRI